ncbi:hypothetical protein PESP_a2461 [Pseudoalteromonas espejiana DSM 9414]|uniref:Orphan protein n=1 Tax=Pseudoalteromonas espejiana TaxID=28107 RepID=A0A510XWI7_9GAMM|nr:DUF6172 family protein [Pseudoalteromonas espejiana]ASM50429.1 hypothetical protein PESP_a2461 [Pseudoalteromonas espejiana DSM 9414]GEK55406.1 hypothetical protein PES01_22510 [Pseudoalteromonas espejiana]
MKKTFTLNHEKIKYPRMVDAAKHEVKKYLKRERNKTLPVEADYWAFDCKFGTNADDAEVVHVAEINNKISEVEKQELTSFYVEILARPAQRESFDLDDDE